MATAIREIDLSEPLVPLEDLDEYTRCMIVLRWHRRILGRCFVPVSADRIGIAALGAHIENNIGPDELRQWVDESLTYDERQSLGDVNRTATVAICTHERAVELERALTAVTTLSPMPQEILAVDNAPVSDATRAVVARFPQVRYVCERRRGLNAARNRAIREAHGDIIAFTDDDAVPEREWLGELVANFSDPRVLCATGLTLPLELETEAQELFEDHCPFAKGFRRRVFDGQHDNPLAVGQVGAGVNMALLRQAVATVGAFDERLDGGMPTRSGGDHEMFVRVLAKGYRIVYEPAAVSWHRHRRTVDEVTETVYGYGVGVYAMWTGLLVERREIGVLKLAWSWFRHDHLPVLLGRRPSQRTSLALAELRGCLHGPAAWFRASRLRANLP